MDSLIEVVLGVIAGAGAWGLIHTSRKKEKNGSAEVFAVRMIEQNNIDLKHENYMLAQENEKLQKRIIQLERRVMQLEHDIKTIKNGKG